MKPVKCLVWDLDHTLWDGILLEDDEVRLRPSVREILRTLDRRGVLLSIASRNNPADVLARLEQLDLGEYFLSPSIGWHPKSQSLQSIAGQLNIGLDAIAFIDDQPFELDEVRFALPQVRCYDAAQLDELLALPEFNPPVTPEAAGRRLLYRSEERRKQAEIAFSDTPEAFLRTLDMHLTLFPPGPDDLLRAEELTVRTHQLNTTGYTYTFEELDALRRSERHLVLLARLEDRFGSYGTIGLALVEKGDAVWSIKLLLMSCRVMARGVGGVLLTHLMQQAQQAGVRLQAEFRANDRNRMMYVTYRFAGFKSIAKQGDVELLQHELDGELSQPQHLTLHIHSEENSLP